MICSNLFYDELYYSFLFRPLIKITLPSSFVDRTVIPFVPEIQKPETSNRVGPNCFRTKAFQTRTRAKAQRSERISDLQNTFIRTET